MPHVGGVPLRRSRAKVVDVGVVGMQLHMAQHAHAIETLVAIPLARRRFAQPGRRQRHALGIGAEAGVVWYRVGIAAEERIEIRRIGFARPENITDQRESVPNIQSCWASRVILSQHTKNKREPTFSTIENIQTLFSPNFRKLKLHQLK
jgi:hypothetical protein